MKTDAEVHEIIEKAEKEIQEICTKYGVDVGIDQGKLVISHVQENGSGGHTTIEKDVGFAPF